MRIGRYTGILLSLAALAVVYLYLGGFVDGLTREGGPSPSEPTGSFPGDATVEDPASEANPADDAVGSAESDVLDSPEDPAPEGNWQTITIGRNESFYVALQRQGLTHDTIMALVNVCKPHANLKKVQRGDTFELALDDSMQFAALRFELDPARYLVVVPDGTGTLDATVSTYPTERVVKGVRGTIQTNLFDALRAEGADPLLADQLADILGWEIDFFRDLRVGDEFTVLYEECTHDGRKVRDDAILAAEFVNQGRAHEAYLFENAFGLPSYYDEQGNSLERQFLRAPLKFSRISSGFTRRRLHPVLKRYVPHYGVDYVAPTGTPVLATADGVVIDRARKTGNGNYVGLRHGQGYESFYLHLSRFAKKLRVGARVKQGDVIGYVGSTGWATAPHLDYRIKKNGQWIDPRKLKLPPAEPVSSKRREEFAQRTADLLQQLESIPDGGRVVVLREQTAQGSDLDDASTMTR